MSNVAIRVEGLGKRYRIGAAEPYQTFREAIMLAAGAPLRNLQRLRKFTSIGGDKANLTWALRDVTFDVAHGEVLGIIGPNGAGKSTLLKILSRITRPTTGRATVYGRVGSLLEVGTGFHPELTGRDNIYLNGSILGMDHKYIARRFDEIVEFAGVEKFIETAVKRYSSGMYLRLAFAVAAHLEPEVLVVDEVLAVGDAAFQKKCLGKMGQVAREGRTVLFVSHALDMVGALCSRCLLLSGGESEFLGQADQAIARYLSRSKGGPTCSFYAAPDESIPLQLLRAEVVNQDGQPCTRFDMFDPILLRLKYSVRAHLEGAIVQVELKRNGAVLFQSFDTDTDPQRLTARSPGEYEVLIALPCPLLKHGRYTLSFATGVANVMAFQRLADVMEFDVDLRSRSSTFLSYAEKRSGLIAVELPWQEVQRDAVADGVDVP